MEQRCKRIYVDTDTINVLRYWWEGFKQQDRTKMRFDFNYALKRYIEVRK